MKKSLWILILPVLFAGNSFGQPLNVEKEKEAIIAVNKEERDAYFARDLSRLETIWQQEPASKRVFATANSYRVLDGWKEIRAYYEEDFNNDEKWDDMTDVIASFSNNEIQIIGKTALLYHDIHWTGDYKGEALDIIQKRIVHFVYEGGFWKFNVAVQMSVPDEEANVE